MKKIGVAVDIVLFSRNKVLLIKRKNRPFRNMWVFPGGFVNYNEELVEAAKRELREETGIGNVKLKQFKTIDTINRDPRGRVITIVYYGNVGGEVKLIVSNETKDVKWFAASKLPKLGFDHSKILKDLLKKVKK